MSLDSLGLWTTSSYTNEIAVKCARADPCWTDLQRMREKKTYDELRYIRDGLPQWIWSKADPSKPDSQFWDGNTEVLAKEFKTHLDYEVEMVEGRLEWYAISGEWKGRQCSKDEMQEDLYGDVRIIACIHEAVELLKVGAFDKALGDRALVHCGRR